MTKKQTKKALKKVTKKGRPTKFQAKVIQKIVGIAVKKSTLAAIDALPVDIRDFVGPILKAYFKKGLKGATKVLASNPHIFGRFWRFISGRSKTQELASAKVCMATGNFMGAGVEILTTLFKGKKYNRAVEFLEPHAAMGHKVVGVLLQKEKIQGKATTHMRLRIRKQGYVDDRTGMQMYADEDAMGCHVDLHFQHGVCAGCCCKNLVKFKAWAKAGTANNEPKLCAADAPRSGTCQPYCDWDTKSKCFRRCSPKDENKGKSCSLKTSCGYTVAAADTLLTMLARAGSLVSLGLHQSGLVGPAAHCYDSSSSTKIRGCCQQ